MPGPVVISPNAVYDDTLLCVALDISANTLTQARRSGHLRHTRKGNRVLYLGQWVLDWLAAAPAATNEYDRARQAGQKRAAKPGDGGREGAA
jgi:hypothetical protein